MDVEAIEQEPVSTIRIEFEKEDESRMNVIEILPTTLKQEPPDDEMHETVVKVEKVEPVVKAVVSLNSKVKDETSSGLQVKEEISLDDAGEGFSGVKTEELMIKSESEYGSDDSSEIHVISDGDKLYACDRCNYKTQSRIELTKHETLIHVEPSSNVDFMSHYTRYITRYACEFCEYKTYSTSLLDVHHLDCHQTNRRCSLCSFVSDNENEYKQHVLLAHTKYIKDYACDQCDYKSYNKTQMKKHIGHLHKKISKKKTHICHFCGYKTFVKGQLKRHIKAKHDNGPVSKYACQQCDYRSPYESYWKRHVSSNIHRNTSDKYSTEKTSNYTPDVFVDLT